MFNPNRVYPLISQSIFAMCHLKTCLFHHKIGPLVPVGLNCFTVYGYLELRICTFQKFSSRLKLIDSLQQLCPFIVEGFQILDLNSRGK